MADRSLPGDDPLAASLRLSVMRLARRLRRERSADGLTLSQLAVLGALERRGPSTLGELAVYEKVSPPSMTRIVKHLVDAGLTTRTSHDTDGRQFVVDLTPAAQRLLDADRRRRDAWLADRLRDLGAEERRILQQAALLLDEVARA